MRFYRTALIWVLRVAGATMLIGGLTLLAVALTASTQVQRGGPSTLDSILTTVPLVVVGAFSLALAELLADRQRGPSRFLQEFE
jgi:hypothetical protein